MADLSRASEVNLRRITMLAVAGAAVIAVLAGLARIGMVTTVGLATAGVHGPLFVVGVFGTLIAIERAVALSASSASHWAYLAPATGVAFIVALLAGSEFAPTLAVCACGLQVGLNFMVIRRQSETFTWMMALASCALTVGTLAWAHYRTIDSALPGWLVYFVGTIAAERLELARLAPPSPHTSGALVGLLILALAASSAVPLVGDSAVRATGLTLSMIGAWQLRYDLARRTVRTRGLPRFAAVGVLAGAAWLVFGGGLLLVSRLPAAGPLRDATIHAVLVGYVFSMVVAHAPIVVPAVARVAFRYHPLLFVPLGLLHSSLCVRIAGDLAGRAPLRSAGTLGNALALAIFVLSNVFVGLRSSRTGNDAPNG
jgi:hypothetical protein